MPLTKSQILAAEDRPILTEPCPEWGGDVTYRPLSGDQRDHYDQVVADRKFPDEGDPNWQGLRAYLVAMALCDDQGSHLAFTELEVQQLGLKAAGPLDRLWERIREASGMNLKAVESAEKNSPPAQSGNSGSSCPSPTGSQSGDSSKS